MLIRTCQKCEVFLSKFKEEICCNPYTDVTPYTQMLAAEFRKWNKATEREVINRLFLNLYAEDAQALRKDLCQLEPHKVFDKLKELEAKKAKCPQRGRLLGCLYHIVSWYSGGYSQLIDLCGRVMDAEQIKYKNVREKYETENKIYEIELILMDFKEDVIHNPDTDVTIRANELAELHYQIDSNCVYRVIKTLFLYLYGQDAAALKSALTKIQWKMFNQDSIKPEQRTEMLQYLYGALASYIGEDFSWLIAMCKKAEKF